MTMLDEECYLIQSLPEKPSMVERPSLLMSRMETQVDLLLDVDSEDDVLPLVNCFCMCLLDLLAVVLDINCRALCFVALLL